MKNLSIGLYLDHAINLENISEILQRILQLKKKIKYRCMLILFNENLKESELKSFTKKHSDILFALHTKFTKNKKFNVHFFIDNFDCGIKNFRYRYTGNIEPGLIEYEKLINHIQFRDK